MRKWILQLAGLGTLRKIVKFSRLNLLVNWWLHCFPVIKILPKSGIRYRARRIESLGLSVEMFDRNELYSISDIFPSIHSFADLGCNVGYFTCWLCDRTNNRQMKGLMIDANSEAIEDAQWHIEANNLLNVYAVHGLLGAKKEGYDDFFLHASNVCSTSTPPLDASLNKTSTWKCVQVPYIGVEQIWRLRFNDLPCDLLKVDIEGSEMDFFRSESQFLKRTKAILCEWHKWRANFSEIEILLHEQNFELKEILHENKGFGTALFIRNR